MITVDYIFIFSKTMGSEADELVDFGLTEGSSRVHPGQGTTNRKFYFENFFLEVLWVHDEMEIQSGPAHATGLWERSMGPVERCAPFGMCLVNTEETDEVFADALTYQPDYFSAGLTVDFIDEPALPWLFRLPFRGEKKPNTKEPLNHPKALRQLTKVEFEITQRTGREALIEEYAQGAIQFNTAYAPKLSLEFDGCRMGHEYQFPSLPLAIKY